MFNPNICPSTFRPPFLPLIPPLGFLSHPHVHIYIHDDLDLNSTYEKKHSVMLYPLPHFPVFFPSPLSGTLSPTTERFSHIANIYVVKGSGIVELSKLMGLVILPFFHFQGDY